MDEFLKRVLPASGDYVVVAIQTIPGLPPPKNKKVFEVVVRSQADAAAAIRRLSTRPLDIYVAIGSYDKNRRTPRSKQAMFLDLDGKDFAGGKLEGMRELVRFCKATALPAPAIVVDSGNGFHCYWPFDTELAVGPWRALAGMLKAKCEELSFNADPTVTSDAARILRVPTTMNHKGPVPVPCRLIRDDGRVFKPADLMQPLSKSTGLDAFAVAPQRTVTPAINADLAGGLEYDRPDTETVKSMMPFVHIPELSSGTRRKVWLDVLLGLHDWSGGNEEGFQIAHEWSMQEPGYESEGDVRKRWLSFKGGRGGKTIGTIIMLAKKGGWKAPEEPEPEQPLPTGRQMPEDIEATTEETEGSYAARVSSAVDRLRNAAVEAAAAAGKMRAPPKDMEKILAEQFIYVKNQDTYYSTSSRDLYTKESIRDIFTPDMARSKAGVPLDPCDVLRRSAKKVVVDSMGFHPGEAAIYSELGKDYVNRYVQPNPELVPTVQEARLFADFVDYLFPRPDDQVFRKYWLQFLAHAVQRPGVKIATALLFISEKYGIGKSTAAFEIPRLLVGWDNARMVTNEILERPFTGYLGEAHLLHLQEVHVNGHWNASTIANRLKGIVTDSTVNVHRKGKDDYDIPNRLLVTATSNYTDAMYITSNQDRRWGVYELVPARGYSAAEHRDYFNLIHKFLRSTRAAGVLRYIFSRVSLAGFDPQNPPPVTLAKARMAFQSLAEEEQLIQDAYDNRERPFHRDLFYMDEIRVMIHNETGKTISSQKAAKWLYKAVPDIARLQSVRGAKGRVIAHRNVEHWKTATSNEVLAELAK